MTGVATLQAVYFGVVASAPIEAKTSGKLAAAIEQNLQLPFMVHSLLFLGIPDGISVSRETAFRATPKS